MSRPSGYFYKMDTGDDLVELDEDNNIYATKEDLFKNIIYTRNC